MTDLPRTQVPEGKSAIRSRIVDFILTTLASAPFDPNDPTQGKLFDSYDKGIMNDMRTLDCPGVRIEEGAEQTMGMLWPYVDKRLRLYFHVKVIAVMGVDPDPLINYYFTRIGQLLVNTDGHLANLTHGVEEAGNSIERNGSADPEPGGTLVIDIDYRHRHGDMSQE